MRRPFRVVVAQESGPTAEDPGMPSRIDDTTIYLRNAVEANLLEALLEQAGIPHYIKAYRDPGFDGSWSFVDAWGHVECSADDEETVRRILRGLRARREGVGS
jgi:hypothetical protein